MTATSYSHNDAFFIVPPSFDAHDACERCGEITRALSFDDEHGQVCAYCADEIREAREMMEDFKNKGVQYAA